MLAAGLGAGACTAGVYDPTPLYTPSPRRRRRQRVAVAQRVTLTVAARPSGTGIVSTNCLQSYAPPATMPTPGQMPAGSYMRTIQKRGHLIAGVSADSLLLGARNPVTNEIEGFDIDMLHAVSQAIFGDPTRSTLKVITAAAARDGPPGRQRGHRARAT